MPDVTFTVDGKKLTAPAGMLLMDACRKTGIAIPACCRDRALEDHHCDGGRP